MITVTFIFILTATVVMTGITILNVCCVQNCLKDHSQFSDDAPLISVLIPARNEEKNLATLLESLTLQTYQNVEVIVLDDNSTDATFSIGDAYIRKFSTWKIIQGEALAEGWLGKPFACFQLRRQARGQYLLFLDADVKLAPHAIARLMELFGGSPEVGLLSCFPNQICTTLPERLIVPLIDLVLYSCAPLPLFEKSLYPRFSAANGQCMLFRTDAYDAIGGHDVVKREILDDIELARASKRAGYRVRVVAGRGGVQCRMYSTIPQIFQGFGKNCFVAVGRKEGKVLLVGAFFALLFIAPFFYLADSSWALMTVTLILFIRICIAIRFGYNVVDAVLGHLPSMLLALCIMAYSWGWFRLGRPEWKGRSVA
jgi:chlorobactene glucosyltransferase